MAAVLVAFSFAVVFPLAPTAPGLVPLGVTFTALGLCALVIGGLSLSAGRRRPDARPLTGVLILIRLVLYAIAVGGGIAALTGGPTIVAAIGTALLGLLAAVVVDLLAAGVLRDIRRQSTREHDPRA
jgi:hypothetical protein